MNKPKKEQVDAALVIVNSPPRSQERYRAGEELRKIVCFRRGEDYEMAAGRVLAAALSSAQADSRRLDALLGTFSNDHWEYGVARFYTPSGNSESYFILDRDEVDRAIAAQAQRGGAK